MAAKNLNYSVGIHNVGSYQAAGVPWITGSTLGADREHRVRFPTVTKSVTVINSDSNGADLYVYFAATGSGPGDGGTEDNGKPVAAKHYITLTDVNSSITMNIRCKDIFVQSAADGGEYQVFAELTNIPRGRMWNLSGSGINEYYKGVNVDKGQMRASQDDDT
jgi:hypothetical protein